MTVVVVASCTLPAFAGAPGGEPGIVSVADRMLATEYDSYEPDQGKQMPVTPRIMAWYAGAPSEALAVMEKMLGTVDQSATVLEVAELAAGYLSGQRLRRARQSVLGATGMDSDAKLSSKQRQQIADYSIGTTLIIAGAELRRSYIYIVDEQGNATDQSLYGFAAIGVGDYLATRHMRFIEYAAHAPLAEAILAAYFAKRLAEATPRVGRKMDLYLLSPRGQILYADPILPGVEGAYQNWRAAEQAQRNKAVAELSEFLHTKPGETATLILGPPPPNAAP